MTLYSSKSGKEKGGVISYKIKDDSITLNYKSRTGGLKSFIYSVSISGRHHVEKIIKFAQRSKNLNSYIENNRIRCKQIP